MTTERPDRGARALAERLHSEFWDDTVIHAATGERACIEMEQRSADAILANGAVFLPDAAEQTKAVAKAWDNGRWAGAWDALSIVRGLNGNGQDEPSDPALSEAESSIRRMILHRHGPEADPALHLEPEGSAPDGG